MGFPYLGLISPVQLVVLNSGARKPLGSDINENVNGGDYIIVFGFNNVVSII